LHDAEPREPRSRVVYPFRRSLSMAFAQAVRFNTTVSAADARRASAAYCQRITQQRLQRAQERSKWYALSEEERAEVLFPPPRKIHTDYRDATPDQQRQVESHFAGEGMRWRAEPLGRTVPVVSVAALDSKNPLHPAQKMLIPKKYHRVWHAGGGGFEKLG